MAPTRQPIDRIALKKLYSDYTDPLKVLFKNISKFTFVRKEWRMTLISKA